MVTPTAPARFAPFRRYRPRALRKGPLTALTLTRGYIAIPQQYNPKTVSRCSCCASSAARRGDIGKPGMSEREAEASVRTAKTPASECRRYVVVVPTALASHKLRRSSHHSEAHIPSSASLMLSLLIPTLITPRCRYKKNFLSVSLQI